MAYPIAFEPATLIHALNCRHLSLMGDVMIRMDLSYFYRLGIAFDALRQIEVDVPIVDVWFRIFSTQQEVGSLIASSDTFRGLLRSTYPVANSLITVLDEITSNTDLDRQFTALDKSRLIVALDKFQAVFVGELAVADAYFVVEKKGLNTIRLVSQGEIIFPADVSVKVPEAIPDLREAAKCLAFELPMAAAFHIFRALEAVLRRYWGAVGGNVTARRHSIEAYLRLFEKHNCGDPKVISALRQFADLHRNPLIHPQDTIDYEEAMSIFGLAQSIMRAMTAKLPVIEEQAVSA